MRYYQLAITDEDRWHLEVDGDKSPLDIWACHYAETPLPMAFAVRVLGKKVDFVHTGWASIPVVSRRMADCLESIAPDDFQRIPAIVQGVADGEWEVLNVLARPDCINYNKSNIVFYPFDHSEKPGKPRGVLKLVIDPGRVEGHRIFRPRDWEITLIVASSVKSLLEKMKITGVEYLPVTEYHHGEDIDDTPQLK